SRLIVLRPSPSSLFPYTTLFRSLAEHARKHGDHERALRHYEAVLGRDVDYPNVRVRVERLRALTGRAAPVAGETIAAGDVAGIRSEEHTSELQSLTKLAGQLLLY